MAKVKFGMMMTDASGKLGGQVFSKNRSGSYVRTKVTPSNPQTTAQQASRATLGAISSNWSDLTDSQRASFNNAVEDWKKTDIFGDLKKPTGKNLFTSLNFNLVSTGQAQINVAPEKVETPYFGFQVVDVTIAGEEMLATFSATNAGYVVEISATAPQSQGTSFMKGKYRVIAQSPSATIGSFNFYDNYVARFGVPVVGANIGFKIKIVAPNGQASVPETALGNISA